MNNTVKSILSADENHVFNFSRLIVLFFDTPNDQVNGYTLPIIEQKMLKHSYGLWSIGVQLKNNKPAGVTDAQIDLLLSSY